VKVGGGNALEKEAGVSEKKNTEEGRKRPTYVAHKGSKKGGEKLSQGEGHHWVEEKGPFSRGGEKSRGREKTNTRMSETNDN